MRELFGGNPAQRATAVVEDQCPVLVCYRRAGAVDRIVVGDGRAVAEFDIPDTGQRQLFQGGVGADETGDRLVGRVGQDRGGSVVLQDAGPVPENRYPVPEFDRLVEIVGDEHDGLTQLRLQPQQFVL